MNMEWISVKDRLPEIKQDEKNDISESKEVLMRFANDEVYKGKLAHWYEDDFTPENFNFYHTDNGEPTGKGEVTHWIYYIPPTT